MPDWRALLRLKIKRSSTFHRQKATGSSAPPGDTTTVEPASEEPPSTNTVVQQASSSHHAAPETQITGDKVLTTVANGLKLALRLLKEAVTGIGVPGLEAAVSGVVKVIDIIEDVRNNDKDLNSLSQRITGVAAAVGKSPNLHPKDEIPEAFRLRIEAFLAVLQALLYEVQDILSDRHLALRTANSEANRGTIVEINTRLDRLINQFSAEGIISLELNVAGARQDVRAVGGKVDGVHQKLDGVDYKVDGVGQKVDDLKEAQIAQEYEALMTKYESLIEKIPRVHARYNDTSTKPSRACHRGTWTELLQGIDSWITGGADDTPYLWLCGEVGVGKSTVAHTIAKGQESLKQLGASFFSRHDSGRQDPHILFPSLAYQLARFDRGIWRALAEILKPDPDIVNRSLIEQFTKLVLEPLSRSGMAASRTVVIAIDGLDECSDPAAVLDALALGTEYVSVRLRVLVCSRPYAAIQSKFKYTPLYHLASQTHFHDINDETLSNDVAAFLTWSLREMASRPANDDLPTPWPTEDQLAELVSQASGLFIVASTYTKYIDDPVEGNSAAQLKRILSRKRVFGSLPLAELDALYDQVLDDLKRSLKSAQELVTARDVVETVILARSAMSMDALSGLLHMEPSDVWSVLRRLTAVILLPEHKNLAITPFHASFGEYIQDDTRCTTRELAVDTMSADRRIAMRCITAIALAAESGISGVEYHSDPMPPDLNYTSMNLAAHFSSSHDHTSGDGELAMEPGIWTWLNLMFTNQHELGHLAKSVKSTGFIDLMKVDGLDAGADAESATSIGRLMIANHALAMNCTSEISLLPTLATESVDNRRSKGLQIIKFVYYNEDEILMRLEDVLLLLADARHWNLHNLPNMSVQGVELDLNLPREVRLLVSTPTTFRGICSISKYLKRIGHADVVSRIRLALEIARTLRNVHETSPLCVHEWLDLDYMLISAEGKHVPTPGLWVVTEPLQLGDSNDGDSFDCQMTRLPFWTPNLFWHSPEDPEDRSPQARKLKEIWNFGSLLFRIMTIHHPLMRYKQLAKGKAALGYYEEFYDVPQWYWDRSIEDRILQARYTTATSALSDTIKGSEEVKAILKSCWAFRAQDRPSMCVVVEKLEAILQAAGEVP